MKVVLAAWACAGTWLLANIAVSNGEPIFGYLIASFAVAVLVSVFYLGWHMGKDD